MRQNARAPRRGAGRPRKRTLESLATKSLETSVGVEPTNQRQTPHGTAGSSGSQTPMVSEVPTSTVPVVPTPTIFTVPPAVPPTAYPESPPVMPTTYPAPPSVVPTAYLAPPPIVPVVAYPAHAPTAPVTPIVPPAVPTYIDPAVSLAGPVAAYAAAPRIPPPAYPTVPPVVLATVVPPVPTVVPTHLPDIVTIRARIPVLAESMKSRFTLFRGEIDPSVAQSLIENMERTFFYMACSESEKAELTAFHFRDEADIWWDTQCSILGEQNITWARFRETFESWYCSRAYQTTRR
ncbi:wiskott-Aldrich syndrome protein homolog 1-like [Zingiber officinale]|uniref:wiskott-Aldrich syndrome protein homolog 1-like n=1 Tax=Zingiber officinale TaxID=94328 RepID=UPI001C4BBC1E|nr:wiskott-Aldrich syndrome protein homolog 1-like [Zingiber officinale]